MKTFGIIIAIILLYIIWQYFELKKFKVTEYRIKTDKLTKPLRLAVVADLHSHQYGRDNERLTAELNRQRPDIILVPGDMIVSGHTQDYDKALHLFTVLSQLAPVYFANGNHEARVEQPESSYYEAYLAYRQSVKQQGVHFVNNQTEHFQWGGQEIDICGVDIPLECYEKGKTVPLPRNYLIQTLGAKSRRHLTLLLAHNPAYTEDYAAWGAELIVSGHTHGGLVRIPGVGSVFSPQFQFFPKYDAGRWELGKSTAIISKGLGTHTFHIRIFDRAEVVMIQLEH